MQLNIYKLEAEDLSFNDLVEYFHQEIGRSYSSSKHGLGVLATHRGGGQAKDRIDEVRTKFGTIKRWSLVYKDIATPISWVSDLTLSSSFIEEDMSFISSSPENYGGCILLHGENLQDLPPILGSDDLPPNSATYLLTWGSAWRIAEKYKIDDFGVKIVANLTDKDKLLKVEAKEIDMNGRSVTSKIHRPSIFSRFKIDLKSESTKSVLGQIEVNSNGFLGRNGGITSVRMNGASSLKFGSTLYAPPNGTSVIEDVFDLGTIYYSQKYKGIHKFLDNLQKIMKNTSEYESVINKIITDMNNSSLDYVLDIEDADLLCPDNFQFDLRVQVDRRNFTTINHAYKDLSQQPRRRKLSSILRAQVTINNNEYIFFENDVYRVPDSIIELLDLNLSKMNLADGIINGQWNKGVQASEYDFNMYVAQQQPEYMSLDQVFYRVSPSQAKYEICDLVSTDGYVVHVKEDRGPGSISHLAAQVYNSAYTFREERGCAADYVNIFRNGPTVASASLGGSLEAGSIPNASQVPKQNLNSSNLNQNNLKFTVCIAKNWGDEGGNNNSKDRILGLSYLRKVVLSGLLDSMQAMGFELHVTTVSIVQEP